MEQSIEHVQKRITQVSAKMADNSAVYDHLSSQNLLPDWHPFSPFFLLWMSSNFLSLNPSKTAFLVIGLPKQLEKLNHSTIHLPNDVILSPVDSARNLGVIFHSNLNFF